MDWYTVEYLYPNGFKKFTEKMFPYVGHTIYPTKAEGNKLILKTDIYFSVSPKYINVSWFIINKLLAFWGQL